MRLMALASSIWLAGCSVFGIREVEEPASHVVARLGAVQIRDYAPRIAAETTVAAGELDARGVGFRRLAGYIFGANHAQAKVAMTAPVAQAQAQAQAGQRIAMTAPVAQARAGQGGAWVIRFFMPAGYTMQSLPQPNDPAVRLVAVAAETYGVLRFSGAPSPASVRREDAALLRALDGSAWRATGDPVAWFYDPPWTLPPLRRNEVAVIVAPR